MAAGMGWKSQGIVTGIGVLRLGRRKTGTPSLKMTPIEG